MDSFKELKASSGEIGLSLPQYGTFSINLGISLSVKRNADVASHDCETDAAMAAADLFEKLEKGSYMYNGKRKRINGDFSKLMFAEKLSPMQKHLLADFRFRCKAVPGCQEIRTKIGHVGFWASCLWQWHFHDYITQ